MLGRLRFRLYCWRMQKRLPLSPRPPVFPYGIVIEALPSASVEFVDCYFAVVEEEINA